MLTKSVKSKGRKFQNFIRDLMLSRAPNLKPDDIRSTSMGVSGPDIQLSTAAKIIYPWAVEAKCQERLNLWKSWDQTKAHVDPEDPYLVPLLFVKKNRSDILVVMSIDDFWSMRFKQGSDMPHIDFTTEGEEEEV